jgi:hypothetical protein
MRQGEALRRDLHCHQQDLPLRQSSSEAAMTALFAALLLLTATPASDDASVLARMEWVESRGNVFARNQSSGCVGLLQVQPRYARVPEPLLYVPVINRIEGARILHRWKHRRCGGRLRCAVRAYACGTKALRDPRACGRYADAVLRRGVE